MASSPTPQSQPVLIRELDSVASWRRGPAAVAAVSLRVDSEVTLEVDAVFPDRLLAVTTPSTSVSSLTGVFGDAGTKAWRSYLDDKDPSLLEALRLPAEWSRRFEVEAVLTLRPTPVNRGQLALDQTLASASVEDPIAAARVLAFTVEAIEDLVDDLLDGALPESLVVAVETALIDSAPFATYPFKARVEDGIAALGNRRSFDDLDLELFQTMLAESTSMTRGAMAVHAGDGGPHATGTRYPVDPTAVPARLVRWSGAGHNEVFVVTEAAKEGNQAYEPGSPMRSQVYIDVHDVDDAEQSLRAYVADRSTGKVLKISPMQVTDHTPEGLDPVSDTLGSHGGRLVADLEYTFPARGDGVETSLHFGVIALHGPLPAVRADKVGTQLVKVDRLAVDFWHCRRQAATAAQLAQRLRQVQDRAQHAAATLDERARILNADADAHARQVDRTLGALARSLQRSSRRAANRLVEEVEARRQAWSTVSSDAPSPAPLLAELDAMMRNVA